MNKSPAGNSILPNTFQHPNIFVDRLMFYLTPEENTVLTFAVRRILGFQENISSRKDNISLSQFTGEIISTKDGSVLSRGCGIGVSAVREALGILLHCSILLPTTEKPDPRKGQEYWLQDNENNIDWAWLERRKAERREEGQKRTAKARYAVRQKGDAGQNTSVAQQARESVRQQASRQSDNNTKPIETHLNPEREEEVRNPLFSFYENKIGFLTPIMADAIEKAEKDYSPMWVTEAIEIAANNGAKTWNYCEAVLKRWKRDGKQEKNPGKKQRAADSGDPNKYVNNEYAWAVEH
jgi:DnaD/phage-associated family protein